METITVFRDSYQRLTDSEYKKGMELARLQGELLGLATAVEYMPAEYISEQVKKLAEKIKKEVDTAVA